jgi:hypothetical protein
MDAFIIVTLLVIALLASASLSLTFGVDSREGFADDRLQPTLR